MVMHPYTKYNWPIWKDKSYGPDKLRWEVEAEEEKIRLKQYVSLRSKGRHNKGNAKRGVSTRLKIRPGDLDR